MDSSITTLSQIKKSDRSICKESYKTYKKSKSMFSSYYRVVGREDNWQSSFKTIRQIVIYRMTNCYGFNPGPRTSIAKFVDFWEKFYASSLNHPRMGLYRMTYYDREGIPISSWRIQ